MLRITALLASLIATHALAQPFFAFSSLEPDGGLIGGMACNDCENSRFITLDLDAGNIVTAAQFRLWNSSEVSAFSWDVRVSLYTGGSAGGFPGDVITTSTTPLSLEADEEGVFTFDLPDTELTAGTLWLGIYATGERPLFWVHNYLGAPSVGNMSTSFRSRDDGTGLWTGSGNTVRQQASLLVIPTPGTALAFGIGSIAIIRRRRSR